jgi:hypothetical protein
VKDLTGRSFGRLVADSLVLPYGKTRNYAWLCRCSCGNEKIIRSGALLAGKTISCGCAHKGVNTTHGETTSGVAEHGATKEYYTWGAIKRRCKPGNEKRHPYYAGRGIKVCERWQVFENFLEDMGRAPTQKHSLDRIDGDGDYEPENCRWVTHEAQCNNRRNNRLTTINGETKTRTQWARVYGISPQTIISRLSSGWDEVRAITTPVQRRTP